MRRAATALPVLVSRSLGVAACLGLARESPAGVIVSDAFDSLTSTLSITSPGSPSVALPDLTPASIHGTLTGLTFVPEPWTPLLLVLGVGLLLVARR